MQSSEEEQSKKHGVIIMIGAAFLFFTLILLSQGWRDGLSLMNNINEMYLFETEDGIYARESRVHTKYFLVVSLAAFAYGSMLMLGALKSPLLSWFSKDTQSSDSDEAL